jgi:signal transduction histidine kinase
MKERAEAAGGSLAVERGPTGGTVVQMVVPGHLAFAM